MIGTPPPPRPDLGVDGSAMRDAPGAHGSLGPVDADGRPLATWRWWEVALVTVLGFVVGGVLSVPVVALMGVTVTEGGASGPSELLQGIVVDIGLMVTLLVWLRRRHPHWKEIIGFPSRRRVPKEVAIGGILGILVRVAAGVASAVIVALLTSATDTVVKLPDQVDTNLAPAAFVTFVIYAVLVAPVTEEFVFRGLLYRSVRDRRGVALGAIASAVPFGLVHFVVNVPWEGVIALQITMVVTGIGLALIYERRKNLVADIAGHAAFNLVAVVAVALGLGLLPGPWR